MDEVYEHVHESGQYAVKVLMKSSRCLNNGSFRRCPGRLQKGDTEYGLRVVGAVGAVGEVGSRPKA